MKIMRPIFIITFFYLIADLSSIALAKEDINKIKLYALYTPSHKVLLDTFFLPSIQDDFEIILEQAEQTSPTAQFMSKGWTDTTILKVDLIIRAIKENWGSFFIFSDVDIQFFKPIKNSILSLIKHHDLVIQKNCPSGVLCSGFFVCRGNEKTLQLWTDVKKYMEKDKTKSDQISLNHCIKRRTKQNSYDIQWAYLPRMFFGGGTLTGYEWRPGNKLPIPRNIVMHHANWTKGIKNKIAQLKYVKKHVEHLKNVTRMVLSSDGNKKEQYEKEIYPSYEVHSQDHMLNQT